MIAAPDTHSATISSPSPGRLKAGSGSAGVGKARTWGIGIAGNVRQQGTHRAYFGPRLQEIGQLRDGFGGDSRVVVETKDVLALGGTEADVERFGEAEVFGKAAVAYLGKFLIERLPRRRSNRYRRRLPEKRRRAFRGSDEAARRD